MNPPFGVSAQKSFPYGFQANMTFQNSLNQSLQNFLENPSPGSSFTAIKTLKPDTYSFATSREVCEAEYLTFIPNPAHPHPIKCDSPDRPVHLHDDTSNDGILHGSSSAVSNIPQEMVLTLPGEKPKKDPPPGWKKMKPFPEDKVTDFKHVIYNLLVEDNNNYDDDSFVQPYKDEKGNEGFRFNESQIPERKLPELYAKYIRKCQLDIQDKTSVLIQDIYKYYLRACIELLSKYFQKVDKYTYLYGEVPLFVKNENLDEAAKRIRKMKTRARTLKKKRKRSS